MLGVILLTGLLTKRKIKTQYRILARIYHPEKHDSESTGMTLNQAEEHFKNINNDYEYLLLLFFLAVLRDPIACSLFGGGIPSQKSGYKITRLCTYLC